MPLPPKPRKAFPSKPSASSRLRLLFLPGRKKTGSVDGGVTSLHVRRRRLDLGVYALRNTRQIHPNKPGFARAAGVPSPTVWGFACLCVCVWVWVGGCVGREFASWPTIHLPLFVLRRQDCSAHARYRAWSGISLGPPKTLCSCCCCCCCCKQWPRRLYSGATLLGCTGCSSCTQSAQLHLHANC